MKISMNAIISKPGFYSFPLMRSSLHVKRRPPFLASVGANRLLLSPRYPDSEQRLWSYGGHLPPRFSSPCLSPPFHSCLILSPGTFSLSHCRDSGLLYTKTFCIKLGPQVQLFETPKGPQYRLYRLSFTTGIDGETGAKLVCVGGGGEGVDGWMDG